MCKNVDPHDPIRTATPELFRMDAQSVLASFCPLSQIHSDDKAVDSGGRPGALLARSRDSHKLP